MAVIIIDYGSGNLKSVFKAFERSSASLVSGRKIIVSKNFKDLRKASHIVLPGVGSYSDCRVGLSKLSGMEEALKWAVIEKRIPFLGICIGMQLLADRGLENGITRGLGWVNGEVVPIKNINIKLKIPHIGWNNIHFDKLNHPIFGNLNNNSDGYFVHSYKFICEKKEDCYASVDYGQKIAAIIGRENIIGTQFHPEKSQAFGLKLIQNFLTWAP